MKKILFVNFIFIFFLLLSQAAEAITVNLYADSAPNVYSSPNYVPWRDAAFAAVYNGTFQNMSNGDFPGTTMFDPKDAIVYSTGDFGKRLHWIYWIPGETIASLTGKFFVKNVADWDGVAYAGGTTPDGPEIGWGQPVSGWMNYDGNNDSIIDGVMGTFGNAWWASDNEALPYSTDGNIWNEVNAADVEALAQQMGYYQTYWDGLWRYRARSEDPWETGTLEVTLNPAPEPSTILLIGIGLIGLAGLGRKRFFKD